MKLIFAILFTVFVLVTTQKTLEQPSTTKGQTTKTGKRLQTIGQTSEHPKTNSDKTSTSAKPKTTQGQTTKNEKLTTASAKPTSTSGKPQPSQSQTTTSGELHTPRNQTTAKDYSTVKSDQKQTTKKSSGFEQWKKAHKKTYSSKTVEENAAKNYAKNENAINEHNKRKNVTFKRGTNENSDMTYEQKKATKMGAKRNVQNNRGRRSVPMKRFKRDAYAIPPPDVLDFR
jgi:Cathepsin propeptide inhibitor domain (I29)